MRAICAHADALSLHTGACSDYRAVPAACSQLATKCTPNWKPNTTGAAKKSADAADGAVDDVNDGAMSAEAVASPTVANAAASASANGNGNAVVSLGPPGTEWCLIEAHWWQAWCGYTRFNVQAAISASPARRHSLQVCDNLITSYPDQNTPPFHYRYSLFISYRDDSCMLNVTADTYASDHITS